MIARANGHEKSPPPPAELFEAEEIDKGHIPGVGHVVLHAAVLGDMWAHMGKTGEADRQEFGLRLLAASIRINGQAIAYDDLKRIPFSKVQLLMALLPEVQRLNGVAAVVEATEAPGKPKVGGGAGEA